MHAEFCGSLRTASDNGIVDWLGKARSPVSKRKQSLEQGYLAQSVWHVSSCHLVCTPRTRQRARSRSTAAWLFIRAGFVAIELTGALADAGIVLDEVAAVEAVVFSLEVSVVADRVKRSRKSATLLHVPLAITTPPVPAARTASKQMMCLEIFVHRFAGSISFQYSFASSSQRLEERGLVSPTAATLRRVRVILAVVAAFSSLARL